MAKISKANIYAIRWLNSQGQSSEQISKELNITHKQVTSILEKTATSGDDVNIPIKTSKTGQYPNLMINKTSVKQNKSVSIMTKEASEVHDAAKSKLVGKNQNMKGIFRPNSN
jgi:orotate phosphoribosyltransferase-like protein